MIVITLLNISVNTGIMLVKTIIKVKRSLKVVIDKVKQFLQRRAKKYQQETTTNTQIFQTSTELNNLKIHNQKQLFKRRSLNSIETISQSTSQQQQPQQNQNSQLSDSSSNNTTIMNDNSFIVGLNNQELILNSQEASLKKKLSGNRHINDIFKFFKKTDTVNNNNSNGNNTGSNKDTKDIFRFFKGQDNNTTNNGNNDQLEFDATGNFNANSRNEMTRGNAADQNQIFND